MQLHVDYYFFQMYQIYTAFVKEVIRNDMNQLESQIDIPDCNVFLSTFKIAIYSPLLILYEVLKVFPPYFKM